jgi:mannose-1-phosphate guanylyltransferase
MFAIIMAGGSGTRFWPASREHLPKQFLKITSNQTLLEETLERISPLVNAQSIYLVVNHLHAEITRQLLPASRVNLLVEPLARNTAACIGLAALHIQAQNPDEPIIVLPADHFISNRQSFLQTLQAAGEVARKGGLVTLGIPATRPETGYGYIELGEKEGESRTETFFAVTRFVEKPNLATAGEYLTSGKHLWNSGIFIFTARTILREIDSCLPTLAQALYKIAPAIGREDYEVLLAEIYQELDSVSIDYGVMEKTRSPVYVFKANFCWSDVGSWQALYELRSADLDSQANLLLGDSLALQASDNLVFSQTARLIALLGVTDLVVVDTADALLVTSKAYSQEVKQFPPLLKQRKDKKLY